MISKNFFNRIVPIAILVILSPVLLLIAFATSLLWIPLLILCSTVYFLAQKTPIGNQVKAFYTKDIKERIEACGSLQAFLITVLNNMLCIAVPKLQRKVTNHGYAVINHDGKIISDIAVEFEDERFPLQLYHYLATCFERYKNLGKWTVLELECTRGGGLEYISKNLKPKKCVGITSSQRMIRFCKQKYNECKNLEFYKGDSDCLIEGDNLNGEKFDLILSVESRSRYGVKRFEKLVKTAEKFLKPGGIFVCADYGKMTEMAQMSNELESSNLRVVKKENLSVNVLHGFRLEKKQKRSLTSITGYVRSLLWKLIQKRREKLETSFKEEESVYLAFLLKKD